MIPMSGRITPSGAALTQPMFQLTVIRLPLGGAGVAYGAGVEVVPVAVAVAVPDTEADVEVEVVDVEMDELVVLVAVV